MMVPAVKALTPVFLKMSLLCGVLQMILTTVPFQLMRSTMHTSELEIGEMMIRGLSQMGMICPMDHFR